MLNYSKVLPIITRNNLPATIETAIHTSVIFHFITIASGTTRYHKIDDIIICGLSLEYFTALSKIFIIMFSK